MNAHTELAEPIAPVFPPIYAMSLKLNGATVEDYAEGDLVKVDTSEEPKQGDLVCVHLRSGKSYMMIMEFALPPHMWARMPYRENPKSEVHALFVGKVLGDPDPRVRTIALQDCWAVHRCAGKLTPEECGQ